MCSIGTFWVFRYPGPLQRHIRCSVLASAFHRPLKNPPFWGFPASSCPQPLHLTSPRQGKVTRTGAEAANNWRLIRQIVSGPLKWSPVWFRWADEQADRQGPLMLPVFPFVLGFELQSTIGLHATTGVSVPEAAIVSSGWFWDN